MMNALVFKVRPDDEDHHANMAGWINFQRVCIGKLNRKRREGRGGWNDPEQCAEYQLIDMLGDHANRLHEQRYSDEALFDVANFCMMVWNHRHIVAGTKPIMPEDRDHE